MSRVLGLLALLLLCACGGPDAQQLNQPQIAADPNALCPALDLAACDVHSHCIAVFYGAWSDSVPEEVFAGCEDRRDFPMRCGWDAAPECSWSELVNPPHCDSPFAIGNFAVCRQVCIRESKCDS